MNKVKQTKEEVSPKKQILKRLKELVKEEYVISVKIINNK